MKKILFFIGLFILMFPLVSCSGNDDENIEDNNSKIVGYWRLYTESYWYTSIINGVRYDEYYEYDKQEANNVERNYFYEDGTGEHRCDDGSGNHDFTWGISGDKLILRYGKSETIYTIRSLSSTTMVLEYGNSDDGSIETYKRIGY